MQLFRQQKCGSKKKNEEKENANAKGTFFRQRKILACVCCCCGSHSPKQIRIRQSQSQSQSQSQEKLKRKIREAETETKRRMQNMPLYQVQWTSGGRRRRSETTTKTASDQRLAMEKRQKKLKSRKAERQRIRKSEKQRRSQASSSWGSPRARPHTLVRSPKNRAEENSGPQTGAQQRHACHYRSLEISFGPLRINSRGNGSYNNNNINSTKLRLTLFVRKLPFLGSKSHSYTLIFEKLNCINHSLT